MQAALKDDVFLNQNFIDTSMLDNRLVSVSFLNFEEFKSYEGGLTPRIANKMTILREILARYFNLE